VKQRREERLEAEREAKRLANPLLGKELRHSERSKWKLSEEIARMWQELEGTYNNNAVVKMEDTLKDEILKLHYLH